MDRSEDLSHNERYWNAISAEYQRLHARRLPSDDPTWGAWGIPERELGVLGDVAGLDVLELGCGGAQWSIALARRGARSTGLDLSEAQLAHARALVAKAGVAVRLVHASADATGLDDGAFDLVFADHGAPTFTDPRRLVPEVARLLRPGGRFVFDMATPLLDVCRDPRKDRVSASLEIDYFGLHRVPSVGEGAPVVFQLPYGEWIRLFRACGLTIEDLVELRPPEDGWTTYTGYVPLEWARRWPAEHIWKVAKPPARR
jgi:SAM-dependent methyltransferase